MLDVIWKPSSCNVEKSVLGEEMARYQRSMLGSGHGFWEWDLNSNKLFWYGTFWRELGYDEVDVLRMTAPEVLLEYIYPDDREGFHAAIINTIKNGVSLDYCYRLKSKLGYYLWVRVNGEGFRDENGWTHHIAGANYNISELKQTEQALRESEARFSRVIAGTRDGIWEWNIETDKIEFSDICWTQIGFSAQEIKDNNWQTIFDWAARMRPRDVERFKSALREHILDRKPFDIEYQVRAKDSSLRWIRARAQATYNLKGRAVKVSGSNMDVTELKSTQLAVVQAKVAAEKANQAKSEFLSSMSHELRTPLNAIMGYVQLFEFEDNLSGDQKNNLSEVRKAGKHLLHLINEVLDLAKIEAGKLTLSMEPVIPDRVLDDCFRLMRPLAEERGISLTRQSQTYGEVPIFADNTRLKQALINLMSNAVKYNREGGSVKVSVTMLPTRVIRISVEDTGYGIAESLQSCVFEPFNRLQADRGAIEGSGVGLVITKRLVEMMGGRIEFRSVADTGSCFWLDIPMADVGQKGVSQCAADVFSEKRQELLVTERKRILYIEDNLANTRLFSKIIEKFEVLEVIVATEPLVGIYMARTESPDLIVLDINLPDLDGYEVLEVLLNDNLTKSIPVVALTANAMSLDVEKGLEAGFVDYLTKPVDVNRLIDVFNRHLA